MGKSPILVGLHISLFKKYILFVLGVFNASVEQADFLTSEAVVLDECGFTVGKHSGSTWKHFIYSK